MLDLLLIEVAGQQQLRLPTYLKPIAITQLALPREMHIIVNSISFVKFSSSYAGM